MSFQVVTHWWEVKGIKSYLQCVEEAKIWRKQLSPSGMGHPPECSKPVISQHSVGCSRIYSVCVCFFFCVFLHVLNVLVFIWLCVRVFLCYCKMTASMHLKIWQKQLSPSCQHNPPKASKLVISQLLVEPTKVGTTGYVRSRFVYFQSSHFCLTH